MNIKNDDVSLPSPFIESRLKSLRRDCSFEVTLPTEPKPGELRGVLTGKYVDLFERVA